MPAFGDTFGPGMLGPVCKISLVQSCPEGLNFIGLLVYYTIHYLQAHNPKVESIGRVVSIFSIRKAVIKHDFGDTPAALTAD